MGVIIQKMVAVLTVIGASLLIATPVQAAASSTTTLHQPATWEVLVSNNGAWANANNNTKPGQIINFLLSYNNRTASDQQVLFKDVLPAHTTLRPGSTYVFSAAHPSGEQTGDTVTTSGLNIGRVGAGKSARVEFQVTVPAARQVPCGATKLTNSAVASVHNSDTRYVAAASFSVVRSCAAAAAPAPTPTPAPAPQPQYQLNSFNFATNHRQVAITNIAYVANGGTSLSSVAVNWGDASRPQTSSRPTSLSHTYARPGNYNVTLTPYFTVNGQRVSAAAKTEVVTVSDTAVIMATAQKPAAPTATAAPAATSPTTLVNTGTHNVLNLFILSMAAGVVLYRFALRYRTH